MAPAKTFEETGKRHTRRFAGTLRIVQTIMNYSFNSTVGEWRLSSPECSLLRSSFPILHPSGGIVVKCGNTKYLFSKLYKLSTVFTRPKIRNGTALSPACPRTSATLLQPAAHSSAVLQWGHRGPGQ